MLIYFIALPALALAALAVVVSRKPDTFRVTRSAVIDAPKDTIFPFIDDFQRWRAWSPYEELDPALMRTYSGETSGKGAVYAWEGNGKAGAGRMEILETEGSARVTIKLDFDRPFKASNTATFTLDERPSGTNVTWAMQGENKLPSKVMSIFIDMDQLVGKDFEKGLLKLKAATEA